MEEGEHRDLEALRWFWDMKECYTEGEDEDGRWKEPHPRGSNGDVDYQRN